MESKKKLEKIISIYQYSTAFLLVACSIYVTYYDLALYSYHPYSITSSFWNFENSVFLGKIFAITISLGESLFIAIVSPTILLGQYITLSPLGSDISLIITGLLLKVTIAVGDMLTNIHYEAEKEDLIIKMNKESAVTVNNYNSSITGSSVSGSNIQSNNSTNNLEQKEMAISHSELLKIIELIDKVRHTVSGDSSVAISSKTRLIKEELTEKNPDGNKVQYLFKDIKDILKTTVSNIIKINFIDKERIDDITKNIESFT